MIAAAERRVQEEKARTGSAGKLAGTFGQNLPQGEVLETIAYLGADAFNALPFTEVDSTEVESSELARSSHDVFNWFRLRFPGLDVKLQELVAGVRVVPQSVAKFGYRRMEAETRYMFSSSATSVSGLVMNLIT